MVKELSETKIKLWVSQNWFMLILILFSSFLLFANLGTAYAPIDEANTMMLSKNTMKYGLPYVWDGEYLVSPFFAGDITKENIWISHPWLQFYITAASFLIFGVNTFAARLPYAAAGLLSIIAIYFLAKFLSKSKYFACLSAVLLALNTTFLVYSRQSRYYSITVLFTILTIHGFLLWLDKPKKRYMIYYIISSALLFHSYYPFWVFLCIGIGIYSVYYIVFKGHLNLIKDFLIGHLVLAVLTVTWFIYAMPHAPLDTGPELNSWLKNFKIYLWKMNIWLAPVYTLFFLYLFLLLINKIRPIKKQSSKIMSIKGFYIICLCIPLYIGFISVIPILTTQYAMPVIPFFVILSSLIIWNMKQFRHWIAGIIIVLCVSTNLWNVMPYIILEKTGINPKVAEAVIPNSRCDFVEGASLEHYLKDELTIRSYLYDHVTSLFQDYDNRVEGIVTYLNENGTKDQTVLSFWADANAIRFYTDMNVIYEFFPLYDNPDMEHLVYQPDIKIDWIIYDTLDFYPPEHRYFTFDLNDYEMVKIDSPKEYHDNVPNPDFFQFHTNKEAPQSLYILKLKQNAE